MAEDEVKTFWRDDVNLWIHRPAVRIAVLLSVLGSLIVIAIGVYWLGKSLVPELTTYLISSCVSVLTALGVFAAELYYEGGKAALKLKAKHVEALAVKDQDHLEELRKVRDQIAIAQRERDETRAAFEDSKKPKKQKGNRNDVIRRFQRVIDNGKQIDPQSMADYENWMAQMKTVVRECLDEHWAKDVIELRPDTLRVQDANDRERARRLLGASIAKIHGWNGELRDGKVDHCIREDFYIDVQA